MDDTAPVDRKTALAHQPFHGVLDLLTGDGLSLQQFIGDGDYGDLIEKKRLALEHDLLEGKVRYVCQKCKKPMVLRSMLVEKDRENRFFLKHRYRSEECGGTRGMTHDAICAMTYANKKESLAHKEYKALIVASLNADASLSDTRVEAAWHALEGVRWRKPDVQTTRGEQRIAMEVQLSTTFVEVVAQRQAFYRQNVGSLIWFFRNLAISDFRQAEDDIFCSNNRNAFLITPETVALSEQKGRMAMECAWQEPYLDGEAIKLRHGRQVVFFDQLSFDVKDDRIPRAYFFDYDSAKAALETELQARLPHTETPTPGSESVAWKVDFNSDDALRQLMEEFVCGYPNHVDNSAMWAVVRKRFATRGFDLPEHFRYSPLFPVLQAAYSAKLGRPVASSQVYLIELANTLFNSHKHALWVFTAMMSLYDRGGLLLARGDKEAWLDKVRQYHQGWLDLDPQYPTDRRYHSLLVFLIPKAVLALSEDPVSYVLRRRPRGSSTRS